MMFDLPPQAQGTAEQQLTALRDYLVRLAQELERVGNGAAAVSDAVVRSEENAAREIRGQAQTLRALIIKNADALSAYTDERVDSLSSEYVAIADYGAYYNRIETNVRQTARDTVESYHYGEAVEGLGRFMTELGGQIRRGVIEDPQTHELHLGIAVSENLSFTGQTQTEGGLIYYELSPGQTLGLYTATGWQFWINGVRRGWFSSEDSMLHVSNITVEELLQLGASWQITALGGFGLRYTGG